MRFVCPLPDAWGQTYLVLRAYWQDGGENGPAPPVPLILNGWYASDRSKYERWQETLAWAKAKSVGHLIPKFSRESGYWVPEISDASPFDEFGPIYLGWTNDPKARLKAGEYQAAMEKLRERWGYVAGPELAGITVPFRFAGAKRRNLVVVVEPGHTPPWGTWTKLSAVELARRTFTMFRKRVNEVIAPHEVDHVTFRERGA